MPRGPTRWVDPFFEWLPVVGVVMLLSWTYYVYMSVLCGSLIEDLAWRALLSVVFHVLFLLCLWSFIYTILAGPLQIPVYFSLSENERERLDATKGFDERRQYLEELGNRRGVLTLGIDGCVRYCAICQRIKPDRCHHCSWCRRCAC
ncbi:palmitoyltransferase ZDHHC2-like [Rhipicephalus microplus]|uniref:palmitoyltransferase ZDHHC2-like n=1 Tax=Rhipicephalus microplus TaxID=6941 RepID=UPI003F6C3CAB